MLQFLLGLSDRQAEQALRCRIDVKYAMAPELDDPGFHHCLLADFRGRLTEGDRADRLLDLALVRERTTQRTDSTHVLAAVAAAGVGEVDGNEFGGGEVVIYAFGPDAEALFRVMEPGLRMLPFRPAHVVLRYGLQSSAQVSLWRTPVHATNALASSVRNSMKTHVPSAALT
ncbi:transposase [Streptomyces sp. NBC_00859]|uniref:transposase n=1 Tax=Streptomyces sp. NBC_00859 TaxID=2903682 RepID=UPI0038706EA6|nr:transposase [Streptomyces sp. NBC_00859]